MTIAEKRKTLHEYIDQANEAELEAIYNDYVDGNESGERYEWWKDEELMEELHKRVENVKNGVDKGFTIEESRAHLEARRKLNAR